ncbi:GNAT family N-acetyltransferase [Bacillus sp. S/N-304-OC-R1]|nr:GNAT family N-acetyltransferase [Bacillus sp. S/N-304-OC-R1]MBY0122789.1 GNAT family N-acetyltransferase [Bacillus sp. S/N-304-OC-R1]
MAKTELPPRWDCDIHNMASKKFAGSLGFQHPIEYSVFIKN